MAATKEDVDGLKEKIAELEELIEGGYEPVIAAPDGTCNVATL